MQKAGQRKFFRNGMVIDEPGLRRLDFREDSIPGR
jgi:putative ribosome biogenesis GTPase RsgA